MGPRLLSALLSTLLCSTQSFLVPSSLTSGASRCPTQIWQHKLSTLRKCEKTLVPVSAIATASSGQQRRRATDALVMSSTSGGSCDRRAFFSEIARTAAGAGLAAAALAPTVAAAKEVDAPVDWKTEFGSVKKSTDLMSSDLRNLATSGDWEELMEQAKSYDQVIRKGVMGKVRKKMPDEVKGDAMTFRNNITFDLIAVNKAARVGDKSKALEVLDVLDADIKKFLSLEKRI